MNKTIYKYQMPVKEEFKLVLPRNAEILRLSDIDGLFWLWALVDLNEPNETRKFRAFKTGSEIPEDLTLLYRGCCAIFVQMELMLYIFEEINV